jgi:UDP-2,3-diacylglucosamine hydrolase
VASSLFVSDLHLSEDRPEANETFFSFIEEKAAKADALYILGDLFEYWVGDDDLSEPFNSVIAGFLQRLSAGGVALYVMHGNRDFLFGRQFAEQTGARLLADPTTLELGGVKTLLMHGDTLCTDDADYQRWRQASRSPDWQQDFATKPLAERRRMARELRVQSGKAIKAKPEEIMDVTQSAVREALHRHGASRLIHGHTHRPGHHELELDGRRCERWVLPDWYGRGGYLEVAGGAARLVRF